MSTRITVLFLTIAAMSCGGKGDQVSRHSIHALPTPSKPESGEPFLTTSGGVVYLSWTEQQNDSSFLKYSVLDNDQWKEPVVIASGENWFVNWADYPVISVEREVMAAHFLERSSKSPYAYDVNLVMSTDSGRNWSRPIKLHDDNKEAEHGFVTILPYGQNFFVTWLDGRNTVMEGMETHDGHHGSMTLRAAIIDTSGNKLNEWELDGRTCDCCQTSAAMTSDGPVVVYRDRSEEEVRDISITRLVGDQWTTPEVIHNDNWKINGCPVNGPKVVAKDQTVAVAWFTSASDSTQVNIAISDDGGKTFTKPVRVNDSTTIGRVDLEMLDEKSFAVSWMEEDNIKVARFFSDGHKEKSIVAGKSSSARTSGFPQMTWMADRLIVAWTDDGERNLKLITLEF